MSCENGSMNAKTRKYAEASRRMAASPEDASLLEQHDALQNIIDAADGYNMDVNIKKQITLSNYSIII